MREWNHSFYEHLYYTLETKKMSNICDFDKLLKTECNFQHFTRNCRIKNFDDFERDLADAYLWRAELLTVKAEGMTICYNMNRCFLTFLKGGKVNVVQYWWNIVEKLKVNNVLPAQLFCCQCKAKSLLETDSLYWWST